MSSYQYRKSHCGDKTVVRSSDLHNGISYTGKITSLYWIRALLISCIGDLGLFSVTPILVMPLDSCCNIHELISLTNVQFYICIFISDFIHCFFIDADMDHTFIQMISTVSIPVLILTMIKWCNTCLPDVSSYNDVLHSYLDLQLVDKRIKINVVNSLKSAEANMYWWADHPSIR